MLTNFLQLGSRFTLPIDNSDFEANEAGHDIRTNNETNVGTKEFQVTVTNPAITSRGIACCCLPIMGSKRNRPEEEEVSMTFDVAFVPYSPAKVNYIQTDKTVISGRFSGCIMSAFQYNGHRRIAHVSASGTGGDTAIVADCKDYMSQLLRQPEYESILHFKPANPTSWKEYHRYNRKHKIFNPDALIILGIVDRDNRGYSVIASRIRGHMRLWEVVYLKNMSDEPYEFAP